MVKSNQVIQKASITLPNELLLPILKVVVPRNCAISGVCRQWHAVWMTFLKESCAQLKESFEFMQTNPFAQVRAYSQMHRSSVPRPVVTASNRGSLLSETRIVVYSGY